MKIERKHNCQHCNKGFEWVYQVPQKYSSVLEVETIPKDKARLYTVVESIEKDNYKLPTKATIYCPKCDRLNNIEIEYHN